LKFTILSHAGISIEHNGIHLIADPWLVGSCYWRSWWNFPEAQPDILNKSQPDYIYLTHLHWDHFHGPSLQKFFDPDTKILVPKVPTKRMIDDLNWLGFRNVIEIEHNEEFELGADFRLSSYQFGFGVDSAMVVSGGDTTLFNCNDCKLFGLPLKQITKRYPKIDFVFRSHSSASPIPFCIDDYTKSFSDYRKSDDYIDEFSYFSLFVGARYAVPFASNHCFLHRDTFHFNESIVSPNTIPERYEEIASKLKKNSKCVVMSPGSSWSSDNEFELTNFDYSQKENYISSLKENYLQKLEIQYAKENEEKADFKLFKKYFDTFLDSIPYFIRKFITIKITIKTSHQDQINYWFIDVNNKDIQILESENKFHPIIEVPSLVLNDCCKKKMFSTWPASKRLKIFLPEKSLLRQVELFFLFLDLYELDTLPLNRNLTWRSISVRLLRWRELAEAVRLFFNYFLLKRPFVIKELWKESLS